MAGTGSTNGQTPNTNIPDDLVEALYAAVTESSFRGSAAGSFQSMWQAILSRVDRYGYNPMPPNHEVAGLTFITRPKLNFASSSLSQDRVLATLATLDPQSLPFSIRCYLDTKFSTRSTILPLAETCPFFNSDLPFIIPLTNCLQTISGFPDFNIDAETTEGGFFGEDQTFAKGSDMNMRTYDLSLTFRDIQGGYIMAMFIYWTRYIALVTRGLVMAYPEDIIARRLNYTCSIYRLILDPSRRFVVKWAKATGCWPASVPIGNAFNIGERENYLHAASQFTIPFKANAIEYMDPIIFRDFNSIVDKFAGQDWKRNRKVAAATAANNFAGIPYLNVGEHGFNELQFWCAQEELTDPFDAIIKQIAAQVKQLTTPTPVQTAPATVST